MENQENATTFSRTSPKQCGFTPTVLSELQRVFNIYSSFSSLREDTHSGDSLNDRRIQMEHGRGVSGNRGTW